MSIVLLKRLLILMV